MHRWPLILFVATPVLAQAISAAAANASGEATGVSRPWVYLEASGRLGYRTLTNGDRIMDFSSAGYMGGGAAIPLVPVKATVSPSGGDDTAAIQEAINQVSAREPVDGLRGAVLLKPGSYDCKGTLTIRASGVVLRGSGAETNGTTLRMGDSPHLCISCSGSSRTKRVGSPARMVDAYVPSGTSSFAVGDASSFKPGDKVLITRPVPTAWIRFMGMDTLVRNGKRETWLSAGSSLETERVIKGIADNALTLDIPLTDSFDAKYLNPPGGLVVKCEVAGQISQVGVESLRIFAPAEVVEITQRHHQAIRMNGVSDAWLRDIVVEDTVNSIGLGSSVNRVTVERVDVRHSVATKGSAKPADFSVNGAQVLFNRCSSTGNNLFYFVTGARVTGPNVLLNCVFHGNGHIQPHARWATGLLVDGCQVPESGIEFMNRGEMGSGHGWTIGWAVAWNCVAQSYIIQQPPGAMNWAIGCKGRRDESGMPFGHKPNLPEGIFDSHGTPVAPTSLYLAQLRERLGPQALKNIGY